MTIPKRSMVLSIVFASVALVLAAQEPSYKYDTAGVQLRGTLTRRSVYGPPGYGETPSQDERTTILVLKLSQPITVKPGSQVIEKDNPNTDTFKNVREVQLFLPRNAGHGVDQLIGKDVLASGVLNEHVVPAEYTDVCMAVKAISLAH
jgi:hypothetical protein